MRIAPPLFVAGIGAGSFSSVVLALHGSPRPLWAFLVLGAALASCLVCRGKSREARSISRALSVLCLRPSLTGRHCGANTPQPF
jgi:hypothetical protein